MTSAEERPPLLSLDREQLQVYASRAKDHEQLTPQQALDSALECQAIVWDHSLWGDELKLRASRTDGKAREITWGITYPISPDIVVASVPRPEPDAPTAVPNSVDTFTYLTFLVDNLNNLHQQSRALVHEWPLDDLDEEPDEAPYSEDEYDPSVEEPVLPTGPAHPTAADIARDSAEGVSDKGDFSPLGGPAFSGGFVSRYDETAPDA